MIRKENKDKKSRSRQEIRIIYVPPLHSICYRIKNRFLSILTRGFAKILDKLPPALTNRIFEISIDERIVEYPFVYQNLGLEKGKVLEVGCWGSRLPIELASQGFDVYGVDIVKYPLSHPNFTFVQADICKMPFQNNFFDVVIAVSTVEHIGLGDPSYGDPKYPNGDKKAIKEMTRVLKIEGTVIITVPFGRKFVSTQHGRIYGLPSLEELLSELEIEKIEYAIRKKENFVPISLKEIERINQPNDVEMVALILAKKRRST